LVDFKNSFEKPTFVPLPTCKFIATDRK